MKKLTTSQASTMLKLQAGMNAKVNPEWLTAGYGFLRAVMIEGCEAMEHHGWKWWKAQEKDMPQLQMELVDIWHFTLSAILVENNGDHDKSVAYTSQDFSNPTVAFDGKNYTVADIDLLAKIQLLIGISAANRFSIELFVAIMQDVGMDWNAMYRQYVGKNVLNFFRQDHGYKAGSYVKIWNGREDNEHLVEVMDSLDIESAEFSDNVYAGLKSRYPTAT